jgi:predicted dinucleotide-binding enzyme
MRIAIVGAGSVGTALAEACRRLGHDVAVGVRDPDDPKHADVDGRTTTAAAVAGADLVVLAVPAGAVPDALDGLPLAAPTVVVDATNAVAGPVPGGAPTVAAYVRSVLDPGIPLVKAFNTIGAEHMVSGTVDGHPAFMPVAGDDGGVDVVVDLARAIGFDAVALGGIDAVPMVEGHARLWIHLMRSGWGRGFGFGVLGQPDRDRPD